jgi:sugar (pentulose or hexulose) kinase
MFLGMDFGTSGARACVLDEVGNIVHENHLAYRDAAGQNPHDWREAMHALLGNLPSHIASRLQRIAVDATSATVLLCDAELQPVSPALLYNDARSLIQAEQLARHAPAGHCASSVTSGLSKFLWLTQNIKLEPARYFMHQADWLSALLTGKGGTSDYHNALKSGYDVELMCWPAWVLQLPNTHLLPHVQSPGSPIAAINPLMAQRFKINSLCSIHAGTTDSIAAFIAAGASQAGEAVTSLGTTLVLKLLSQTRVEAAQYGVYSHRFGDLWLAGGASNAGGGVLRKYFSDAQLADLSTQIDATTDSPLDYYPLPGTGERFPLSDAQLQPRLTPRPADDVAFLHGILQGLSRIESAGYVKLLALGATPLTSVTTCGGGASNATWQQMRARLLNVPVHRAAHAEAAVGAALLARQAGI